MTEPAGTCCFVLHTHLPWVAHAGAWPVGEEWLHQAWSASYLPIVQLLERLADEGRRDVLTLGVTPVVAAMLDDPYLLREFHLWLGDWQARAWELGSGGGPHAPLAAYEHQRATAALACFETRWQHGGSPLIRGLADSGVVELLGGPATHPFQPLVVADRLVDFQLSVGLDDAALRLGRRPRGIWAPECGYAPGLEERYAAADVGHFLVDGPTLLGSIGPGATGAAWRVGDTDVVAFGRDLDVTYRVWSPRTGYPGGRWYRDFHHFDHPSGFRAFRVTGRRIDEKKPYDPVAGHAATERDAQDFVRHVRERVDQLARERGRPGLVVVAYDTELFGHWWHEGPLWLERVLRLLPEAGVRVTTLSGAIEAGHVDGDATLRPGSWGSGKDWRVWEGGAVAELVDESRDIQQRLLDVTNKLVRGRVGRLPALDQLAREAFLVMSSDWAFCVSKDTAADYARSRHRTHADRFGQLAGLLESRRGHAAELLAGRLRELDGPFGHLDARALAVPGGVVARSTG